jgi:hypothetical protein
MSFLIFVILSVLFIGLAYHFTFSEPKEKASDGEQSSDDEPEVMPQNRRGAFENARQRRA